MGKSFYDLDYIIEINEKRVEQFVMSYNKVLERLTNIILIYSVLSIFLIPIVQHIIFSDRLGIVFYGSFAIFSILLLVSLYFTIRLIIPAKLAYLEPPQKYYEDIRLLYEETIQDKREIENLLKASYINELEKTIENNAKAFRRKSSFYYKALLLALCPAIPYLVCLGAHIAEKDKQVQKVEIVNFPAK